MGSFHNDGISYRAAIAHAPNDDTVIDCIAFMATTGDGDVAIVDAGGNAATMYCLRGVIYPVAAVKIKDTGTTATAFVIFR